MDELDDDLDFKPKRSGGALPWVLLLLVLIGAGVGAFFGYGALSQEQETAAAAVKSSEDAAAKIKALEAEKAGLEAARKALEEQKGTLEGEVKDKDAELAKLKATYDSLNDKMQDEIKKGEIHLTQSGNRIQVEMVDKILFDSGSAELSKRGGEVLARVGQVLATIEDKQIQVSGHTDDSPPTPKLRETYPTNWELSCARAVTVVRFLAEKGGVPTRRLQASGYGQFHPIGTNANAEGRARNRRIEILLTPLLDAKPTSLVAEVPVKSASAKSASAKAAKSKVVLAKATRKAPAKKKSHR